MALIAKSQPGSAPGGLVWSHPGDVVDVPAELAWELLRMPAGGFTEVLPDPDPPAAALAVVDGEGEEPADYNAARRARKARQRTEVLEAS